MDDLLLTCAALNTLKGLGPRRGQRLWLADRIDPEKASHAGGQLTRLRLKGRQSKVNHSTSASTDSWSGKPVYICSIRQQSFLRAGWE